MLSRSSGSGRGPRSCEHVQPRLGMVGVVEVALLADPEPGDRGGRVRRRAAPAARRRATRRSGPRRPPSRRRARCRSRPPARASRAAPSRACPRTPPAAPARRWPARRAGTRGPAARCRRASSRSGAPSRCRRRCSGESRRRAGRGSRRWPSRAGCATVIVVLAPQQQELEQRGLRELRRAAEAAVAASKLSPARATASSSAPSCSGSGRGRGGRCSRGARAAARRPPGSARGPRCQASRDRPQHVAPGGHPGARLGREVGAAVERQLLGGEEHVQRPAAVPADALQRPPCRGRRRRDAPRGRPSRTRSWRSSAAAVAGSSKDSRSITWHQWQEE